MTISCFDHGTYGHRTSKTYPFSGNQWLRSHDSAWLLGTQSWFLFWLGTSSCLGWKLLSWIVYHIISYIIKQMGFSLQPTSVQKTSRIWISLNLICLSGNPPSFSEVYPTFRHVQMEFPMLPLFKTLLRRPYGLLSVWILSVIRVIPQCHCQKHVSSNKCCPFFSRLSSKCGCIKWWIWAYLPLFEQQDCDSLQYISTTPKLIIRINQQGFWTLNYSHQISSINYHYI